MRKPFIALLALGLVGASAAAARAEDGYGLTTAAVDAVPTALAIVAVAAPSDDLLVPALAVYALAAPSWWCFAPGPSPRRPPRW